MRKRRAWLEKDIEKLENAGVKVVVVVYTPMSPPIPPSIRIKIETLKGIRKLAIVEKRNIWLVEVESPIPHYEKVNSVEEVIKYLPRSIY